MDLIIEQSRLLHGPDSREQNRLRHEPDRADKAASGAWKKCRTGYCKSMTREGAIPLIHMHTHTPHAAVIIIIK